MFDGTFDERPLGFAALAFASLPKLLFDLRHALVHILELLLIGLALEVEFTCVVSEAAGAASRNRQNYAEESQYLSNLHSQSFVFLWRSRLAWVIAGGGSTLAAMCG